jgi:osmotically-inducible protein OsmY
MANRTPKSYDEITRKTVPNPDASYRPTPEQERQAYEGFRALDADEQALADRVQDAIAEAGHDTSHLQFEITRDRVTLRGQVRNHRAIEDILLAIHRVEGVGDVVDRTVIAQ